MANLNATKAAEHDRKHVDLLDNETAETERPLTTAVSAAGGAVGGAVLGMAVGGPVGAAVGAIITGVATSLLAKDVADMMDPDVDNYWTGEHKKQPYSSAGDYQTFRPAYQYGAAASNTYSGKSFEEVSPALRDDWAKRGQKTNLQWEQAEPAIRNAYQRPKSMNTSSTTGMPGASASTSGVNASGNNSNMGGSFSSMNNASASTTRTTNM